jgi:two-component system OmpR family response regulator
MSAAPHILVVDDDATIRQLLADYLSERELRVTGVPDGPAMQKVLNEAVVDLIVLDLKLPSENGMSIARRLRAQSSIPIIILTGHGDDVDRIVGLELGADDYLTKPFNPRELLARIRTILRRAQAHTTAPPEGGKLRAQRFAGWELDLRTRRVARRARTRPEPGPTAGNESWLRGRRVRSQCRRAGLAFAEENRGRPEPPATHQDSTWCRILPGG